MMNIEFDYDPFYRHLPQVGLDSLDLVDAEADRVRTELGWHLAAFIGVFDADLNWICLVQLGYAQERFGGANPWCLPGGGVAKNEMPSDAVVRELKEETGLILTVSDLVPVGWFARPYYRPHHRPETQGELLTLYATIANPDDPSLRPNPPETVDVVFAPFDLDRFLEIPTSGSGEVPFQPLAGKHWAWWGRAAQKALEDQLTHNPLIWTYESKEQMQDEPPWPHQPIVPVSVDLSKIQKRD